MKSARLRAITARAFMQLVEDQVHILKSDELLFE